MRYITCILVFFLMVGCSEDTEKKVGEQLAEKILESNTKHEADIDIKGERMRITTKDGDATMTFGKSTKMPQGFPKDVPIYQVSVLEMAMEVPAGYSLSFTTKDSVSKVSGWYLNTMSGKGWTKEMAMNMNDQSVFMFRKGERNVALTLAPEENMTRVSLTSTKNE